MVKIQLQPSLWLAIVLSVAHLLAICLTWTLALPLWAKAGLCLVLFASGVYYVWRSARLAFPTAIIGLELNDDCSCAIQSKGSNWFAGRVLGTSFVSPYFTILNIKPEDHWQVKHVVIFPDALDSEEFRKLRIWLKWKLSKNTV